MSTTDAISLRPTPAFVRTTAPVEEEEPFRFGTPVLYVPEIPTADDSGSETDEEDHETRIQSSWHHRALLGDEGRLLYTDYQDTDWSAASTAREDVAEPDTIVF